MKTREVGPTAIARAKSNAPPPASKIRFQTNAPEAAL
jgi:hypothetical protein